MILSEMLMWCDNIKYYVAILQHLILLIRKHPYVNI